MKNIKSFEDFINESNINESLNLKLKKDYSILDSGTDEWIEDCEYLGFDTNNQDYMFRVSEGPGDKFVFFAISKNDLKSMVKESSSIEDVNSVNEASALNHLYKYKGKTIEDVEVKDVKGWDKLTIKFDTGELIIEPYSKGGGKVGLSYGGKIKTY